MRLLWFVTRGLLFIFLLKINDTSQQLKMSNYKLSYSHGFRRNQHQFITHSYIIHFMQCCFYYHNPHKHFMQLVNFDVLLTIHLSITLANDQLGAQIFNTFIIILYMFRAISCSSSGGQIVLIQHLVSSLSVSDRSVHRLRKNWSSFSTCAPNDHLLRVTIPDAVLIQFDLLRILLETCRGL
jgi:hypothetical protein